MLICTLRRIHAAAIVLALAFSWQPAALAAPEAANFIVNTTTDQPDVLPGNGVCEVVSLGSGFCTLRAAIQEANAWPGDDTITFSAAIPVPATFTLTRAGADDTALNGDLDITSNVTITGRGAANTIIDGNWNVTNDRVFHILSGTVTMSGLTIQNGNPPGPSSSGAGIYNFGTLFLTSSVLTNNLKGGLYNGGTASLTDVMLNGNTANRGGGIYNAGQLSVANSTISGNSGGPDGGGLEIFSGAVTMTNSIVSGNHADSGGGIDVNVATVVTMTNVIVSGNTATNGAGLSNDGQVTWTGGTLSGNQATTTGGGLYNDGDNEPYQTVATLTNVSVAGNGAANGGGVENLGTLWLTGVTLSGNTSTQNGAGIHNSANLGGGLLYARNSTLANNQAGMAGGGIYNTGTVNLYNDTLAFNRADNSGDEGSTPGGGVYNQGYTFNIRNGLVVGNHQGAAGPLDDCSGTISSFGALRISTTAGCSISGPSGLVTTGSVGPLANNGGPTQTVALLAGSAAIDAADPVLGCVDYEGTMPTDQRVGARVVGVRCDVGAYEFGAKVPWAYLPLVLR